ncbi:MAG: YbaK/EbsC family protein [Candidatus Magasanikbacteria bacterium]|nr:YbaK/EbsC family protein [Candidatus Magasanikbacteria bacterium]
MIPKKILGYLEKNKVKHEVVKHRPVFTAYDLAATLKEKMNKVAKTLLIKVGGKRYIIIVLPAHLKIDFKKLQKILKVEKVELATEKTIKKLLNAKPGSLLPFGALNKMETFLDKALFKTEHALFGAGSFTESLRLKVKDLAKLENATVADFGSAAKKSVKKAVVKVKKVVKKVRK